MKSLIAVAGKGGTGKTTLSTFIIRALLEKQVSLLAIDADPNNNLWQSLGLPPGQTVMDIVEELMRNKGAAPSGITKERYVDLKIQEALEESNGFDLLSMGRPEGPGCYCYANNLLRGLIEKLSKNYDVVVMDNEAGMEHLSRRLMRVINYLFVVSDFSAVGIRSAKNISDLVNGLDIKVKAKGLVVNKAKGDLGRLKGEIDKTGLDLVGVIPYDDDVEEMSVKGIPAFKSADDSTAYKAVKEMLTGTESIKRELIWT